MIETSQKTFLTSTNHYMKTIYKYPVTVGIDCTYQMPEGVEPLYFGIDGKQELCLWALIDTKGPLVSMVFFVVSTGDEVPDDKVWYRGTCVQGRFVWHLFQRSR